MPKADDPYYNRTRIPDEFIKDVGVTGLTPQEEFINREKKYMVDGVDVRRFSNSKDGGMAPQNDPYYGRRRLSKQEIAGVAETGLSPEEEYLNRERKYSVNGVDVRKFGSTSSGGWRPSDDPYYGRKKVSDAQTVGIGDTGNAPAQDYEVRERKMSLANFSGDPFAIIAGSGNRQSVSAAGGAAAAATEATRRRSSAVAPDGAAAAQTHHNAYGGPGLEPIDSKPELPPVNIGHDSVQRGYGNNTTGAGYGDNTIGTDYGHNTTGTGLTSGADTSAYPNTTTTTTSTTQHIGAGTHHAGASSDHNGQASYYDAATSEFDDPDSVAPDVRR